MGKHKYIETPEKLWELFIAYRKDIEDNPIHKVEYVGKDGNKVNTPLLRPLTIEGFKNYCRKHESEIHHYWNNTDEKYTEYCTIITRIREEIRQNQIEGGMVGVYNSNLTARLNGLYDNQNVASTTKIQLLNNDPLDDSN